MVLECLVRVGFRMEGWHPGLSIGMNKSCLAL